MLEKNFPNGQFLLENISHEHKGHDAYNTNSHFKILVISKKFHDISKVERHRQVYQALAEAIKKEIHALNILALSPQEAQIREEISKFFAR